jgi:hypothetical protein
MITRRQMCEHINLKLFLFTALGYGLDDRGFESWQGLGIFLFTTAYRPALGPTQPHIQMRTGGSFLKRTEREADHSPPSSNEVKNAWKLYLHSPNKFSWRGTQFKKKSTGTTLPSALQWMSELILFNANISDYINFGCINWNILIKQNTIRHI